MFSNELLVSITDNAFLVVSSRPQPKLPLTALIEKLSTFLTIPRAHGDFQRQCVDIIICCEALFLLL
jgi:hypothetical protein